MLSLEEMAENFKALDSDENLLAAFRKTDHTNIISYVSGLGDDGIISQIHMFTLRQRAIRLHVGSIARPETSIYNYQKPTPQLITIEEPIVQPVNANDGLQPVDAIMPSITSQQPANNPGQGFAGVDMQAFETWATWDDDPVPQRPLPKFSNLPPKKRKCLPYLQWKSIQEYVEREKVLQRNDVLMAVRGLGLRKSKKKKKTKQVKIVVNKGTVYQRIKSRNIEIKPLTGHDQLYQDAVKQRSNVPRKKN